MSGKIKGLIVYPGGAPRRITLDNTLRSLQEAVGGFIEPVPCVISNNIQLLCDEEGKLKGLLPNFAVNGDLIVGPALFVGLNELGDDFGDLPERYVGPITDLICKGREALKWAE